MRQMLPVMIPRRRMSDAAGAAALTLMVAILCASCGIVGLDSASEPSRDEQGHVTQQEDVSVFHLRLGDCTQGSAIGEVASVGATPCDQPHAYEVFGVAQFEGDTYEPTAIEAFAQQACTREFTAFVGVPFDDSVLEVTYLTPTQDSFAQRDDREVTCLVGTGTGPSTGTLRGAGK